MAFDDDTNGVWYDDQGRPHITVAPGAPVGDQASQVGQGLPISNQLPAELPVETFNPDQPITPGPINKLYDIMTGGNDQERYQLFPERIVRSALSLPGDVMSGKVRTPLNPPPVGSEEDYSADPFLQRVQDMTALMGGGGVAMAERDALGTAGSRLVQPKEYPIAPRSEWYGEANFENTGGQMQTMTPDEFLAQSRPLKIDEVSRENIDDLKQHIEQGKTLDPLQLYKNGKEDGRHRAYAAKELGIENVPVINFRLKSDNEAAAPVAAAESHSFTTDAYHGTGKFIGDSVKVGGEWPDKAEFYSTSNPNLANRYSLVNKKSQNPQILPLKLNTSDYHIYDAKGNAWDAINDDAIKEAKKLGKSGVTIKNVIDEPDEFRHSDEKNTIYIAFDPSTVRSRFAKFDQNKFSKNGLLLSDTTKPGMALSAIEKAPVFHSAVENAVNTASLKSANPDQWLGTIANAKGVKPEELDWTGLKDWLGEQQGPVSKEQVQDFLQQNKVGLKEVDKGNNQVKPWEELTQNEKNNFEIALKQKYPKYDKDNLQSYYEEAAEEGMGLAGKDLTKYSKYQLPGGENYREKLLTLPSANDQYIKFTEAMRAKYGDKPLGQMPMTNDERTFIDKQINKFGEDGGNYKSSHWDEPNILAHIRMNDRNVEGKPALHIEEIQSDWHQQGREHGYKITDAQKQQLETIDNKLTTGLSEGDIGNPDMDAVLKTAVDKKVISPQEAANYKQWSKGENSNIPDAPFKKTWLELAAKRMIREAAEQGKDVLSWTPGEAQAARYDLSKHIKRVELTDNSSGGIGRPKMEGPFQGGMLHAYDHNGKEVIGKYIRNENELAEHIGKEAAEKLMNVKPIESRSSGFGVRSRKLVDQNLKVGGEGMHYFYDVMLPKVLEKLTGQKMKKSNINKQPALVYKNQNVNYIDLPQSVKDTALHKGFPLFSSGIMLTPTDDNPFKKYKLTPVEGNPFEEKK